jgi:hypothetical protein
VCGRRLYGKTRRVSSGYSYYACEAVPAHHAGKDWFATHPKSLWVREDKLLELVRGFFTRRIFGPDRYALLATTEADEPTVEDATLARATAIRSKIRELERQQANVVKELREYQSTGDEDIDQEWRGQLRESFAEIAAKRKDLDAQLNALAAGPEAPTASDPRLLDRLPLMEADLERLPEDMERELFDGFQLQVRYHQPTRRVTLRVTIDGDALPRLISVSQAIMQRAGSHAIQLRNRERPPTALPVGGPRSFSLAGSAPGSAPGWRHTCTF